MRFLERSVWMNTVTRELEAGPVFIRFGRDTDNYRWVALQIRVPPKRLYCGLGFEKRANVLRIVGNWPHIEFYEPQAQG